MPLSIFWRFRHLISGPTNASLKEFVQIHQLSESSSLSWSFVFVRASLMHTSADLGQLFWTSSILKELRKGQNIFTSKVIMTNYWGLTKYVYLEGKYRLDAGADFTNFLSFWPADLTRGKGPMKLLSSTQLPVREYFAWYVYFKANTTVIIATTFSLNLTLFGTY